MASGTVLARTSDEQPPAEEWKDIPGFPGYQASTLGRTRSPRKILKPSPTSRGYLSVVLYRDGKQNSRLVSRLVLEAFVGPCPPGCEARHVLTNDKADNRLANLAWGTRRENAADRVRHGTVMYGDGNHRTKITDAQVRELLARAAAADRWYGLVKRLAIEYGISREHCRDILHGRQRAATSKGAVRGQSRLSGSNRRPELYESSALPAELRRHESSSCVETSAEPFGHLRPPDSEETPALRNPPDGFQG
jgi:hypothetical protein